MPRGTYDKSPLFQVIAWCCDTPAIAWINGDNGLWRHVAQIGHNSLRGGHILMQCSRGLIIIFIMQSSNPNIYIYSNALT